MEHSTINRAGSIQLTSKLAPKNNQEYKLYDSVDIDWNGYKPDPQTTLHTTDDLIAYIGGVKNAVDNIPEPENTYINNKYVLAYINSQSTPNTPSNATYNFDSKVLSGLGSWTTDLSKLNTSTKIWFSNITFYSDGTNTGWTSPTEYVTKESILTNLPKSYSYAVTAYCSTDSTITRISTPGENGYSAGSYSYVRHALLTNPTAKAANGPVVEFTQQIPSSGQIWVTYNNYIDNGEGYEGERYESTGWTMPVKSINIQQCIDSAHQKAQEYYENQLSDSQSELNEVLADANTKLGEAEQKIQAAQELLDAIESGDVDAVGLQKQISELRSYINVYGWNGIKDGVQFTMDTTEGLQEQSETFVMTLNKEYLASDLVEEYRLTFMGELEQNDVKIKAVKEGPLYVIKITDFGTLTNDNASSNNYYLAETWKGAFIGIDNGCGITTDIMSPDDPIVTGTYYKNTVTYAQGIFDAMQGKFKMLAGQADTSEDNYKKALLEVAYNQILSEVSNTNTVDGTVKAAMVNIADNEIKNRVYDYDKEGGKIDTTILKMTPAQIVLKAISGEGDKDDYSELESAFIDIMKDNITLSVTNKTGNGGSISLKVGETEVAESGSEITLDADSIVITGTTIANAIHSTGLYIGKTQSGVTQILGDGTVSFANGISGATSRFNIDGTGSLAGGLIDWHRDSYNNLELQVRGVITATGGSIGGWTIGDDKLHSEKDGKSIVIMPDSLYSQNSTKIGWQLKNDGSGQLANNAISWKSDGTVTFGSNVNIKNMLNSQTITVGNGSSQFNQDGSGWLANKNIQWDKDGSGLTSYVGKYTQGVTLINESNYTNYLFKLTSSNYSTYLKGYRLGYEIPDSGTHILDLHECSTIIVFDPQLLINKRITTIVLPCSAKDLTKDYAVAPVKHDGTFMTMSECNSIIGNKYEIAIDAGAGTSLTIYYGPDLSEAQEYTLEVDNSSMVHTLTKTPGSRLWYVQGPANKTITTGDAVLLNYTCVKCVYMTSKTGGYNSKPLYSTHNALVWESLPSTMDYGVIWNLELK